MDTDLVQREPERLHGDRNLTNRWFDLHPEVFLISSGLILLFVVLTLLFQKPAEEAFSALQSSITAYMGWFFVLTVTFFLCFTVYLACSNLGEVRLGGPEARPEFSLFAWLSMLLSAGMGIGLMFWSVAEPMLHFLSPPEILAANKVVAKSIPAAQQALGITFFHWGLHAWGIYALVGLSLAFFSFNRGLPLAPRSVLYPLLGDKIYQWQGNIVDIIAVASTLFGLATSLGFGVKQVNAGLHFLFGLPVSINLQILLIALITGAATISVVSGLDKGVRLLSEINMGVAALFLLFVFVAGPTTFLLNLFVETTGYYLSLLPRLSFWRGAFSENEWQGNWTIFYWGWWISWSPFVGIFIARISKGRTVREFLVSVLLLPSLLTFIWMSVLGGSALHLELNNTGASIAPAVREDTATALFALLQTLPLSFISSVASTLLVTIFFVTSSDSGSLVIDNLTSGGKLDSPVGQRIFWAVTEGVIAAVLLLGGGLTALQTATITTGLPFAFLLLVMSYSIWIELHAERDKLG